MAPIESFHDVRFPVDLAFGATGGPVRRTEVVTLASGKERRNARWAGSRRRYNVGYGIKTSDDLFRVLEFFEGRLGRLFAFRFRDPVDWKSCPINQEISPMDQEVGIGDGTTRIFRLHKRYGTPPAAYDRVIRRPVSESLQIALDGELVSSSDYTFDFDAGEVRFSSDSTPEPGLLITAGFEFDVPVRFDADEILVNLSHFQSGEIQSITLVEVV